MIGETNPVSDADRFARTLADYERRIADLERASQRKTALGFSVRRSTNDSAIAAAGSGNITFNTLISDAGFGLTGFTTGSAFTVPAGGAGLYVVVAGIYYGGNVSAVYPSVSVNGSPSVASPSGPGTTRDRDYFSDVARLAVGDSLRLRVENLSGVSITPTATAADARTKATPFLQAWRIST